MPLQRPAIDAALRRVAVKNFLSPIKLGTELRPEGHLHLTIDIDVRDRDDGSPIALTFSFPVPPKARASHDALFAYVREQLVWVMAHEVDEALHIDGCRVADPHDEYVGDLDARLAG